LVEPCSEHGTVVLRVHGASIVTSDLNSCISRALDSCWGPVWSLYSNKTV